MSATELVILSSSPVPRCAHVFSPPRPAQQPYSTPSHTSPDLPALSNVLARKETAAVRKRLHFGAAADRERVGMKDGEGVENGERVTGVEQRGVTGELNARGSEIEGHEKGSGDQRERLLQPESKTATGAGEENEEVSKYFAHDRNNVSDSGTGKAMAKPRKNKKQSGPKETRKKTEKKSGDTQGKIKKAKVTKPSAGQKHGIKEPDSVMSNDKGNKTTLVDVSNDLHDSNQAQGAPEPASVNALAANVEAEPSIAIARRKSWTPPKESEGLPPSNQAESFLGQRAASATLSSGPYILKVLPEFRFDNTASRKTATPEPEHADRESTVKRRRVEV